MCILNIEVAGFSKMLVSTNQTHTTISQKTTIYIFIDMKTSNLRYDVHTFLKHIVDTNRHINHFVCVHFSSKQTPYKNISNKHDSCDCKGNFLSWDVTSHSLIKNYHCFGGTRCLHVQDRKNWYSYKRRDVHDQGLNQSNGSKECCPIFKGRVNSKSKVKK
jgi:hypothetical protein